MSLRDLIKNDSKEIGLALLSEEINIEQLTLKKYINNEKLEDDVKTLIKNNYSEYLNSRLYEDIKTLHFYALGSILKETHGLNNVHFVLLPTKLDCKRMVTEIIEDINSAIYLTEYRKIPGIKQYIIDATGPNFKNIVNQKDKYIELAKENSVVIFGNRRRLTWGGLNYTFNGLDINTVKATIYNIFPKIKFEPSFVDEIAIQIAGSHEEFNRHVKAIKLCLSKNNSVTVDNLKLYLGG